MSSNSEIENMENEVNTKMYIVCFGCIYWFLVFHYLL